MNNITREELKELHREGTARLINVLDAEYFEKGHIPGSANIPLSNEEFVELVEQEVGGRNRPVIVYCASSDCDASHRAAVALEEAGFTQVHEYEEGLKGWQNAGEAIERGNVALPEFHPQ